MKYIHPENQVLEVLNTKDKLLNNLSSLDNVFQKVVRLSIIDNYSETDCLTTLLQYNLIPVSDIFNYDYLKEERKSFSRGLMSELSSSCIEARYQKRLAAERQMNEKNSLLVNKYLYNVDYYNY